MVDAPSRQGHRFDVMYRTWLSSEERAPLRRILKTLRGARVWIVGGAVRDLLSRVPSDDVDLATDMTPEEVMNRFGDRAIPTGIRFGTVTVMASGQPFEVTTLRSERGYGDGRRPTEVEWGTQIEEDLARRDLTINAMAIDVSTGKLIDPYGGMEDLLHRRLRAVGIRRNGSLRTGSGSCVPTDSWTLAHTEWSQTRACGMPSPHTCGHARSDLQGANLDGIQTHPIRNRPKRDPTSNAGGWSLGSCLTAGMHLGRGSAHAPRRWAFGCAPSTDGPDMAHPGRSSEMVLKALTLSNAQLAVPLRLRKGIAMSLPSNQGERRRHRVLLGEDLDAVMRVRAATVDRFAEDDRRERREALLGTSEPSQEQVVSSMADG